MVASSFQHHGSVQPAQDEPTSPGALRFARYHRAKPVDLVLAQSHYTWLVCMGREYYYGYASAHKALRDLLLWAAETTPEDTHWIFTAAQKELADAAIARRHVVSDISDVSDASDDKNHSSKFASHLSADSTIAVQEPQPPPHSDDSCFTDFFANSCTLSSHGISSADNRFHQHQQQQKGEQFSLANFHKENLSSSASSSSSSYSTSSSTSCCSTSFSCVDKEPEPVLVRARLPHHVCEWLTMSAHDYTHDDLSLAFSIVCAVALNLGVSQDIFNVGDEDLAFASSADLYAMIGIHHSSSPSR